MDTAGTQNPRSTQKATALRAAFIALVLLQVCLVEGIVFVAISGVDSSFFFMFVANAVCLSFITAVGESFFLVRQWIIQYIQKTEDAIWRLITVDFIPMYISYVIARIAKLENLVLMTLAFSSIVYLPAGLTALLRFLFSKNRCSMRVNIIAALSLFVIFIAATFLAAHFEPLEAFYSPIVFCFLMFFLNAFTLHVLILNSHRSAPRFSIIMNIKALLSLVFILLITSFITLELILNNITIASQINVVPLNKAPVPNDDVLLLKTHYSDDDIDRRIVKAAEFIHPKLRSTAYIYNLKTKELKKTKFHRDKWSFIPNISPVDIPACKRMVFFERSNYSWGLHSPFPSSSLVARDYTGKAIISRKLKEPDFMPLNDGRQILINDANNHKYIWDVCSNKIRKTRVMDDYSFRLNTTNPFSTSSSNDEYYFSYIYFDSDDNPNWIGFYEYDVSQDSLKTLPVSGGESHGRLYTSGEITPSFAGDKALICKCIKTSNKEDTDESQKCDVFIYSLKSNIILKKLDRYKQCYDIDFTFMPKGDLLFSTKINSHITLMDWNGSVKKTIPIKNARRFMINGHPQWLSDDTVLLAGVSSPLEDKVIVDLTTGKSEWVSDIVARHEKKK